MAKANNFVKTNKLNAISKIISLFNTHTELNILNLTKKFQ